MLTDDDLTTELRGAFRADTDEIAYRGRRRPRRTTSIAVPLTAAALVAGVVAAGAELRGRDAAPTATPASASSASASASASGPALASPSAGSFSAVTEGLRLSDFTVRVQSLMGQDAIVRANFRDEVPPGLKKIALPVDGKPVPAWVGTDPKTGDNAVFVRVPKAGGGDHVFAVLSETGNLKILLALMSGPPRPIPLTKN